MIDGMLQIRQDFRIFLREIRELIEDKNERLIPLLQKDILPRIGSAYRC